MKKCYCGKNRKDSLLNMLKGDMFGKANLNMKNMKVKTCLAQSCLLLTVLVILYFFFYGHAYEIEFRFPLESHLKEAPNLRSEDGRINDPALRTLVVPLLKEQCGSMDRRALRQPPPRPVDAGSSKPDAFGQTRAEDLFRAPGAFRASRLCQPRGRVSTSFAGAPSRHAYQSRVRQAVLDASREGRANW